MSVDEPVLGIEGLKVHFQDKERGIRNAFAEPDTVRAVDGVSVDILEDEVLVIVGESGCGKSTLGRAAIGIERPTEGNVTYRGQDIWDAKEMRGDIRIPYSEIRRSLQHIHQDPGSSLNPNRTIRSTLLEPLKNTRPEMSNEQRVERILTLLDYVGMSPPEDYIGRYPHQLSGGEQQRVALIRVFLMNPDLILADEAVSALDVSLRIDIMDLMLELQELYGTSFIYISHNLSNARYLAGRSGGRIAIMYLGEIVEIGTPEEIIHDPQHPYTKAIRWAAPDINPHEGSDSGELPVRSIDIPDPINPPNGCRFHTRCLEAREICAEEHPELREADGESGQRVACYRAFEDHPYWESESIVPDNH